MKKKILLAEDELALRLLFEEELQEEGYEVITAGDGREAINGSKKAKWISLFWISSCQLWMGLRP